jgi:hypothetical protein
MHIFTAVADYKPVYDIGVISRFAKVIGGFEPVVDAIDEMRRDIGLVKASYPLVDE